MYKILLLFILVGVGSVYSACSNGICDIPLKSDFTLTWNRVAHFDKNGDTWTPVDVNLFKTNMYYLIKDDTYDLYYVGLESGIGIVFQKGSESNAKAIWFKIDSDPELSNERIHAPIFKKIIIAGSKVYASTMFGSIVIAFDRITNINQFSDQLTITKVFEKDELVSNEKTVIVDMIYSFSRLFVLSSDIDLQGDKTTFNYYNMKSGRITVIEANGEWDIVDTYSSLHNTWGAYSLATDGNSKVVACGVSRFVIWDNQIQTFTEKEAMGFTYTSAVYIPSSDTYFLFASGFVLEYNSQLSLKWLTLLKDNPTVYSAYLYSASGVNSILITTLESRVYRFDLLNKLQWRSNVLDANSITSLIVSDDTTELYVTTTNALRKVYVLSSSDCISLGCNCNDDPFCGFCEESLQCSFKSQCQKVHLTYQCPAVEYTSVFRGDISGGTEIKVGFNYLDEIHLNKYVCKIDGVDLPTTASLSNKEIICITNDVESAGTYPFYIAIDIDGNSIRLTDDYDFEFYNCKDLGCNTCNSNEYPECRWSKAELCSRGTSASESCSSIISVTPDIAPFDNPTDIIIIANHTFHESQNIKCKFGDIEVEIEEVINDNGVRCKTPDFSGNPSIGQIDLIVTIDSKRVTSSFLFQFYSCSSYLTCSDCLSYRNHCKWEKVTGCDSLAVGDDVQTFSCPTITHTNPPAINADLNQFELFGSNLNLNAFEGTEFSCLIDYKNGTTLQTLVELSGSSKIICKNNHLYKARNTEVFVSIIAYGSPEYFYSNTINVKLYSCSQASTCDSCLTSLDPNLPACNWCKSSGEYQCTSNNSGECLGHCPSILKVEPSKFVVNRNIDIIITLSDTFKRNLRNIDESDLIEAEIYDDDDTYQGSCTYNSVTEKVECSISPIANPKKYFLRIKLGDSIYTEGYEYEIFSCNDIQTCYGCIDDAEYQFCSWVDGISCVDYDPGNPKNIDPCPFIQLSENKQYSVNGEELITMTLSPDYDSILNFEEDSFKCQFVFSDFTYESTDTTYDTVNNVVSCTTPAVSKAGTYELHLTYMGSIYAIQENIIFYDCSVDNNKHCSDTCLTKNPSYCSYCTVKSECTAIHECKEHPFKYTSGLCPVAELDPPYISHTDSKILNITFNRNVDYDYPIDCFFTIITAGASFGGSNTFRKKDATKITENGVTTVQCPTPPITLPPGRYDALAMIDILVDLSSIGEVGYEPIASLLKAPLPFTWVDCNMDESEANSGASWCKSCNNLRHEYCGFCLSDFKCSVNEECSKPMNFSQSASSCPSLFEIVPSVGDPSGGTEVILRGEGFIDDPNITVLVGLNEAKILSINDSEIIFVTPKAESDGDANVQVFFGEYLYSSDLLVFSYQNSKLAPGIIAAIVIIILLIIIAAIIILLYMKKKRIGYFKKRLEEPNYAQIAFGKHNDSLLYPLPKDNYKLLESVLLEYDKRFLFALSRVVPLTEHDKVAKSLIEFYHSHSMAKDAIIAMIAEEVKVEKSENTIFRGNSMTSKMFKYYSKLIGIRFLWSKSARLLNELNNIGKQRMKEKDKPADTSGGSSLLTMEMEIDPVRTAKGDFTEEDTQANVYQLIVTCQKIFSTLLRSLKEMPVEFREIFCECDKYIRERFGSADSVYKAIGGFIFLRFICPAFTAPQAYGLLESQPNVVTQRQLVLIGKVLQNLANMTIPGHKEAFMIELTSFFEKNIPKMREFYLSILSMPSQEEIEEQKAHFPLPIEPSDVSLTVKHNALGEIWSIISEIKRFPEKLEEACKDDPEEAQRLIEIYMKMKKKYGKKKNYDDENEDPETERLVKKKKKKDTD